MGDGKMGKRRVLDNDDKLIAFFSKKSLIQLVRQKK